MTAKPEQPKAASEHLLTENARLREALEMVAAPWDSGATTVPGVFPLLSAEFQRRLNIAGEALAALSERTE